MTPDTTALHALADHAAPVGNPVWLDPATVRALCDGYDEAQRFAALVADLRALIDQRGGLTKADLRAVIDRHAGEQS